MRRWLASVPATEPVGMAESLFGCPIATFLKAQGVCTPAVGPHTVRWSLSTERPEDSPRYVLPDWASDFVRAIDRSLPVKAITAAHAAALLHQVTKGAA